MIAKTPQGILWKGLNTLLKVHRMWFVRNMFFSTADLKLWHRVEKFEQFQLLLLLVSSALWLYWKAFHFMLNYVDFLKNPHLQGYLVTRIKGDKLHTKLCVKHILTRVQSHFDYHPNQESCSSQKSLTLSDIKWWWQKTEGGRGNRNRKLWEEGNNERQQQTPGKDVWRI